MWNKHRKEPLPKERRIGLKISSYKTNDNHIQKMCDRDTLIEHVSEDAPPHAPQLYFILYSTVVLYIGFGVKKIRYGVSCPKIPPTNPPNIYFLTA